MSEGRATSQPFYFGKRERRLFGVYHPVLRPQVAQPDLPSTGVILCNPFGQEAVRAHRMLRVLADRLAQSGRAVLRFDPYATGDSAGDDSEADLDGWTDDLHEADLKLRELARVNQTIWIGMRLGASVALRAAHQARQGLSRLILWDPVLDGARYLQFLRERHVQSLVRTFSLVTKPSPPELARDPGSYQDEAIGFSLSPRLRQQIASLDLEVCNLPACPESIVAITDPDDPDGEHLATLRCDDTRLVIVQLHHGTDWTTDTAENIALVPAGALKLLLQHATATL